jgi:hypothetical protein
LISIDRDAMRGLLEDRPELAAVVSRAITERKEVVSSSRAAAVASPAPLEERSNQLLGKIKKFFSL